MDFHGFRSVFISRYLADFPAVSSAIQKDRPRRLYTRCFFFFDLTKKNLCLQVVLVLSSVTIALARFFDFLRVFFCFFFFVFVAIIVRCCRGNKRFKNQGKRARARIPRVLLRPELLRSAGSLNLLFRENEWQRVFSSRPWYPYTSNFYNHQFHSSFTNAKLENLSFLFSI